jgi:hypothetical protein
MQSSLQATVRSEEECWKDGFNPAVVANHVDRLGYMLFWLASLKGFCPYCRILTLINTSTVTIILRYCIILVIHCTNFLAPSTVSTSITGNDVYIQTMPVCKHCNQENQAKGGTNNKKVKYCVVLKVKSR